MTFDITDQTVVVSVSDFDRLANLISEIDESKGNTNVQLTYINMAHECIDGMLGEHAQLVYPNEETENEQK